MKTIKYLLLTISMCFLGLGCYAQTTQEKLSRARALSEQGSACMQQKDYAKADELFGEALALYDVTPEAIVHEHALTMHLKSFTMAQMDRKAEALAMAEKAVELLKSIKGLPAVDWQYTLMNNTITYCEQLGEKEKAVEYAKQNVTLCSVNKNNSVEHIDAMIRLALIYYKNGDYSLCYNLMMDCLILSNRYLKGEAWQRHYMDVMFTLGMSDFFMGDYLGAVGYLLPCTYDDIVSLSPFTAACASVRLGECFIELTDDIPGCMKYIDMAKKLRDEHGIKSENLDAVIEVARLKIEMEDENDSVVHIDECEQLLNGYDWSGMYGSTLADVLMLLGREHLSNDNLEEALEYMRTAIEAMEEMGLTKTDMYYRACEKYCSALVLSDVVVDGNETGVAVNRLNENIREQIYYYFPRMTEQQREKMWNRYQRWFEVFLPHLAVISTDADALKGLYNGRLINNGILLRSAISLQELVSRSDDEELQEMQQQVNVLHAKLLQLNTQREQDPEVDNAQESFNIQTNISRLEQRIVKGAERFGDFMADIKINADSVRNSLAKGDAAVEFLSFGCHDESIINRLKNDYNLTGDYPEGTEVIVSLTMRREWDAPKLTLHCLANQLNGAEENLEKLNALVWKPIENILQGCHRVYFAPAGKIYGMPVESANRKFSFYRLSSTRELALKSQTKGHDAVVYGGINYELGVDAMQQDMRNYPALGNRSLAVGGKRDTHRPAIGQIKPLAGTLVEAENITKTIENAHRKDLGVKIITGDNGTEASFKDLSHKHKSLIHIGTHGYYFSADDTEQELFDNLDFDMATEYANNEDIAMMRSGLLFAGAQNLFDGEKVPENVEDGMLTANEVASMNLDGLNLVVLSACQTGLGDVTSEGVYGLQRGFKKAGAQGILMSLWSVDDAATQILMSEFYRNWVGDDAHKPMDAHDALEKAKGAVRSNPKYADPHFWSAFVLLDGIR